MGEKQKALKEKRKVGENNGQLRFVRQHGWRTQARLDQHFSPSLNLQDYQLLYHMAAPSPATQACTLSYNLLHEKIHMVLIPCHLLLILGSPDFSKRQ